MTRTFVTTRGDNVTTTMTDREAADLILRSSNSTFGKDLAEKFVRFGRLSDKQIPWLHKIANEVGQPVAPAVTATALSFPRVVALMAAAARRLRFPKVRFTMAAGTVQLSIAGPRSRYAGQVVVTDGGRYPDNKFYGSIGATFARSRNCPDWIVAALTALELDPAGVAGEYGRRTGNCCFCRRELTDARSVSVGYGPICAGHYNLPWGEVAREDVEAAIRGEIAGIETASIAADVTPANDGDTDEESER